MQTFLPFLDYDDCARALDWRRLNKQRIECKQILNALRGVSTGWRNHPATKAWAGHERELCVYALAMCREWLARGKNDHVDLLGQFSEWLGQFPDTGAPQFLTEELCAKHRGILHGKDPSHYSAFSEAP